MHDGPVDESGYTKLDDADWHGGSLPEGLEDEHGYTHIAMMLTWALEAGRLERAHDAEVQEVAARVRTRTCTLHDVALFFDAKIVLEEFVPATRPFLSEYYGDDGYFADLGELCASLPSVYHHPWTWDAYEVVRERIEDRWRQHESLGWRPPTQETGSIPE